MNRLNGRYALAAPFAAAALLLGAAGCGGDDDSANLPPGVAAVVGQTKIPAARLDSMSADFPDLKATLLSRLIQQKWVDAEVRARGVTVSEDDLDLPQSEDSHAPAMPPDALREVRGKAIRRRLAESILGHRPTPTDDQVQAFYREHKDLYRVPEQRYAYSVSGPTEDVVNRVKAALERGTTWAEAAEQYSSAGAEYAYKGFVEGEDKSPLAGAAYAAKEGELVGPIKYEDVWYLFALAPIIPGGQASLEQAKPEVIATLEPILERRAVRRMYEALSDRYRDKTTCADELKVPECKNGPSNDGSA